MSRRSHLPSFSWVVSVGSALVLGVTVCTACTASTEVIGATTEGTTVEIERVIDGDSLEVVRGDDVLEVRLLGINAPELRTPDGAETCPGRAATDELTSLVSAGPVELVDGGTDRFGRTLAELVVDGRSINMAMVEAGWALALWSSDDRAGVERMQSASAAELGWWGDTCGAPRAHPTVSGHQMNPPGDDRERLDEEWVELTNPGPDPIDLGGWVLRDETTSNRFTLDGPTLEPGSSVRVHVGAGRSTGSDVYLGEEFPVWSNNGETVLLLQPDGVIAAHAFVEGG